jgi:hypothetical protein
MTARDELFRRVAGAFIDETKANQLLDAYRDEVLREHAAEKQSEREEAETDRAYGASATERIWSRLCYPPLGRNCTETYANRLLGRFRAEVLREVYAAIEDPAQREAVGGGLGWETARDVVHNLLRKTTGGAS